MTPPDDLCQFLVAGRPAIRVSRDLDVILSDDMSHQDLTAAVQILAPMAARYLLTTTLPIREVTIHHG